MRIYCLCFLFLSMLSSCSPEISSPATTPAIGEPAPTSLFSGSYSNDITLKVALQKEIYQPLIDAFTAENPNIHVQFVNVFRTRDMSAQEWAHEADIVLRPFGPAYAYLQPQDIPWLNLQPYIQADRGFKTSDFYTNTLAVGQIDDRIYVIPQIIVLPLLKYNKSLWMKQGLPPLQHPGQWAEFRAMLEQHSPPPSVAQKDSYSLIDVDGYTILIGELEAAGVNPLQTSSDEIRLDDPAIVQALTTVANFAKTHIIYLPKHSSNLRTQAELIQKQQATIFPSFILSSTTSPPFQVGTMPLPYQTDSSLTTTGFMISAGSQHPEAAWRLVSYLSQNDVIPSYLSEGFPARLSLAARAHFWETLDPEIHAAIETTMIRPPITKHAPNALYFHLDLLVKAIHSIVYDSADPTQAAVQAQTTLAKRLRESTALVASPTPFEVSTPLPPISDHASTSHASTSVIFAALGLDQEQIQLLAQRFSTLHPDIQIQLAAPQRTQALRIDRIAATSDCFAWSLPPSTRISESALDLQPFVDMERDFYADYPKVFITPFQRNGKLYALPLTMELPFISYQPELFEQMGISPPAVDWTIDNFVQLSRLLTSHTTSDSQYGFVDLGYQTHTLDQWLEISQITLTEEHNGQKTPKFTDPKVIRGVQAYTDLLKQTSPHDHLIGYLPTNTINDDTPLITSKHVAMWINGGLLNFRDAPIVPFPQSSTGQLPQPTIQSSLYISKTSTHPQACWEWMQFLSQEGIQLGGFPVRRSVATSNAFLAQAPYGTAEVYRSYQQRLDEIPQINQMDNTHGEQVSLNLYWFYQAVDYSLQGKDIAEALKLAQNRTDSYITCLQNHQDTSTCAHQVDPDYQGSLEFPSP